MVTENEQMSIIKVEGLRSAKFTFEVLNLPDSNPRKLLNGILSTKDQVRLHHEEGLNGLKPQSV